MQEFGHDAVGGSHQAAPGLLQGLQFDRIVEFHVLPGRDQALFQLRDQGGVAGQDLAGGRDPGAEILRVLLPDEMVREQVFGAGPFAFQGLQFCRGFGLFQLQAFRFVADRIDPVPRLHQRRLIHQALHGQGGVVEFAEQLPDLHGFAHVDVQGLQPAVFQRRDVLVGPFGFAVEADAVQAAGQEQQDRDGGGQPDDPGPAVEELLHEVVAAAAEGGTLEFVFGHGALLPTVPRWCVA